MAFRRVLIMNLPREEKRKYVCIGGLIASGANYDQIKVWKCIDDRDYKYTEDAFEGAIGDGFDSFKKPLENGHYRDVPISYAFQAWNFHRIWRYIASSDETFFFMQDDHGISPSRTYYDIRDMSNNLLAFDPNLKIFLIGDSNEYENGNMKADLVPGMDNVSRGLFGQNDTHFVISPMGAQWLIDNFDWDGFRKPVRNYQNWIDQLTLKENRDKQPTNVYTLVGDDYVFAFGREVLTSTVHEDRDFGNKPWEILRKPEDTVRGEGEV